MTQLILNCININSTTPFAFVANSKYPANVFVQNNSIVMLIVAFITTEQMSPNIKTLSKLVDYSSQKS